MDRGRKGKEEGGKMEREREARRGRIEMGIGQQRARKL
jgi:hypothetical protein